MPPDSIVFILKQRRKGFGTRQVLSETIRPAGDLWSITDAIGEGFEGMVKVQLETFDLEKKLEQIFPWDGETGS